MKNTLIKFSAFAIIIFLCNWFSSEIDNILTPFIMIYLIPIVFIIFIIFFVRSIIIIKKKYSSFGVKSFIPLRIIILTGILVLFFPFTSAKVWTEYQLYTNQRYEIISMVENHELIPDELGSIELPSGYKHLSCDGEIHVESHTDTELVLGFWVYRGIFINPYQMTYYSSSGDDEFLKELEGKVLNYKKMDDFWYSAKVY